jgi:hypothetical protein
MGGQADGQGFNPSPWIQNQQQYQPVGGAQGFNPSLGAPSPGLGGMPTMQRPMAPNMVQQPGPFSGMAMQGMPGGNPVPRGTQEMGYLQTGAPQMGSMQFGYQGGRAQKGRTAQFR